MKAAKRSRGWNTVWATLNWRIGISTETSPAAAARAYYERAMAVQPDIAIVTSRAKYGLAKLAECEGDFDAAARQYEALIADAGLSGYPAVMMAETAKAGLEGLREPVSMIAKRPATQPATQPAPRATTRPAADPATAPAGG
jgi:hypothetical protein